MRGTPSLSALLWCLLVSSCGVGAERQQGQPRTESTTAASQQDAAKPPQAPADVRKFAVIIAGVGGEEGYTKTFSSQAVRLRDALAGRLGFPENQIALLTEHGPGGGEDAVEGAPKSVTGKATAEEVRRAFAHVKTAAKPDSLVLVILIGHGSSDSQQAKFNLVGPDLSAKDYGALLDTLPTRKVAFVDCSSSSGDFVKPMSAEGRVIVTATRSGNEQNATVFAEHFIAALTDDAADADKNGRISVLEAFDYATKLTADWYKSKDRLATEHALLDDNGDGVGHEQATAGDGLLAKTTYLDSKPIGQAGTNQELARLLAKREEMEQAVEKLKARKAAMKPEDYEAELEKLLLDLAKLNQEIKTKQK
ncbi:MAG TPA: hypothetical protein VFV34_28170 [Blastocatellia bacterium]|nr:hypothetical protein [Blastocatellia bacterium]